MSDPFSAPSQPLPAEFDLIEEYENETNAALEGSIALVRRQGRPTIDVEMEVVRELTEDDIPRLMDRPPVNIDPTALTAKLRSTHHRPAQLIAQGMALYDVALVTGYTVAYLSTLQNNPAFKGLIAHYSGIEEIAHIDTMKRLNSLGVDAMEVLQERLTDGPDEFSTRELTELVELAIVRPATAAMKATGQVAAAGAAPRAFNVIFRSAPPSRPAANVEIEGEIVK